MFSLSGKKIFTLKNIIFLGISIILFHVGEGFYSAWKTQEAVNYFDIAYRSVMDIVAPGTLLIEDFMKYGIHKLPSPVDNPVGYTFSLIGLIIATQALAWATIGNGMIWRNWLEKRRQKREVLESLEKIENS